MHPEIIMEIEELIGKGKILKAIDLLVSNTDKSDLELHARVLTLSSNFYQIRNKEGVSLKYFGDEITGITMAILNILGQEREKSPKGKKQNTLDSRLQKIENKLDSLLLILKSNESIPSQVKFSFWGLLEIVSKNYFISANNAISNGELLDYSPVINEYSKALEYELLAKFFIPFSEYLEKPEFSSKNLTEDDEITKWYFSNDQLISGKSTDIINKFIKSLQDNYNGQINFKSFVEKRIQNYDFNEIVKKIKFTRSFTNANNKNKIITFSEAEKFEKEIVELFGLLITEKKRLK